MVGALVSRLKFSKGVIDIEPIRKCVRQVTTQNNVFTISLPASRLARKLISNRHAVPVDHRRAPVHLEFWHRLVSDRTLFLDVWRVRILDHSRIPPALFSPDFPGSLDRAVIDGYLRSGSI